jgi:hypothetical protein
MNNPQNADAPSINGIAGDIVDADPSNGARRPGKNTAAAKLAKARFKWIAALVLVLAVGAVLAVTLHSATPAAGGKTHGFSGYVCHGTQATLFDNINAEAVSNGASRPTFSTHGMAYCLMYIQTYHWNKGAGSPPGSVGLVRLGGPAALPESIASLSAKASSSQGVPNVNWFASVPITKPVILDGTYSCADSDPSTWSSDKASGGAGFCIVYANLAVPPGR